MVSTIRKRGLRFSLSAAKRAIVVLAAASVASLVAGSHLSSRVFHSSWWVITPYWVLATSVGIPLFLSIGPVSRNRLWPKLSGGEVIDLLHRLASDGATLVLITHDERIAAGFARRVQMRDGEIVGDLRA